MLSPIEILQRKGMNTNSPVACVNDVSQSDMDLTQHKRAILELIGDEYISLLDDCLDSRHAQYMHAYLVDALVKLHNAKETDAMVAVVNRAMHKATLLYNRVTTGDMSYVIAKSERDEALSPHQSSKQDRAKDLYEIHKDKTRREIIDVFVKELGMSKAGGSTYYQSLKKQNGEKNHE